jgi:hypothetical protein
MPRCSPPSTAMTRPATRWPLPRTSKIEQNNLRVFPRVLVPGVVRSSKARLRPDASRLGCSLLSASIFLSWHSRNALTSTYPLFRLTCGSHPAILIYASSHFGLRGGSQFEGYPLPSSRLGSSWLSVSMFLSYPLPSYTRLLLAECQHFPQLPTPLL